MSWSENKINNQKISYKSNIPQSYQDIIYYLDQHWAPTTSQIIKIIDSLLQNPSTKFPAILLTGTNGKSSTIYFLHKLLQQEGLRVGTYTTPHFKQYNERFSINGTSISNDTFILYAHQIIQLVFKHAIKATTQDILAAIAFLFFAQEKVDVAIFEQQSLLQFDPITYCKPKIIAITRIISEFEQEKEAMLTSIQNLFDKNSLIISAEQSKVMLQELALLAKEKKATWIMPIRKLAPLSYPFEQLYGRPAALAERIAKTYLCSFLPEHNKRLFSSLKRYPIPISSKKRDSLLDFWLNTEIKIPHRFDIIQDKKPIILLDSAHNIDAFKNLFLGIRLLHYKNPLKKIYIIFGCHRQKFDQSIFLKTIRSFFKKTAALHIIFCSTKPNIAEQNNPSWNEQEVAVIAKQEKINVHTYKNLKNALESIIRQSNDPQDMIVITGSQAIITEFWNYKKEKEL